MIGIAIGVPFGAAVLGEDEVAPGLIYAEVGNVSDDVIVIAYDDTLDGTSVPATGDYSLSGTTQTVSSVAINANEVRLTLSGDIVDTDTVLLTYTSGVNPVRDSAENDAANLVDEPVTSNVQVYMTDSYGDYVLDSYGDKIPLPH